MLAKSDNTFFDFFKRLKTRKIQYFGEKSQNMFWTNEKIIWKTWKIKYVGEKWQNTFRKKAGGNDCHTQKINILPKMTKHFSEKWNIYWKNTKNQIFCRKMTKHFLNKKINWKTQKINKCYVMLWFLFRPVFAPK